jgi:hypothetical protein
MPFDNSPAQISYGMYPDFYPPVREQSHSMIDSYMMNIIMDMIQVISSLIVANKDSASDPVVSDVFTSETLSSSDNSKSSDTDKHSESEKASKPTQQNKNPQEGNSLSSSLETINANNGKIILDWDNTIDTDDDYTIKPDAQKWIRELAESGADVYIVSGNKGSYKMLEHLIRLDPEHKSFWTDVINNNYYNSKPGEKENAYMSITNGDYSKAVLFDDTQKNIDDWNRISNGQGLFYKPTEEDSIGNPNNNIDEEYATYDKVSETLAKFANQLS